METASTFFKQLWGTYLMVATGQEMIREKKILHGQGNVREFYSGSGKIGIFKKRQGKLKL